MFLKQGLYTQNPLVGPYVAAAYFGYDLPDFETRNHLTRSVNILDRLDSELTKERCWTYSGLMVGLWQCSAPPTRSWASTATQHQQHSRDNRSRRHGSRKPEGGAGSSLLRHAAGLGPGVKELRPSVLNNFPQSPVQH